MLSRDDFAAELPPPRDDEPATLRQDIVDELEDHLQCGLRRELLTNPTDHGTAYQRVLNRFGNPAAIARQLWFDALKENVMSQRITTVAIILLTLLCGGLFLFTWQSQTANRELIQQQQATMAEFVQNLKDLRDSAAITQPTEWNRLTVRCVYDKSGGEPVAGAKLNLTSHSEGTRDMPPLTETARTDGSVDFGKLRYGQYTLRVDVQDKLTLSQIVSIRVGQDAELEIICPRPDAKASLTVRLNSDVPIPEDLSPNLWFGFSAKVVPAEESHVWTTQETGDLDEPFFFIVIRPDGHSVVSLLSTQRPDWFRYEEISQNPNSETSATDAMSRWSQYRITYAPDAPWSETVQLPPGKYELSPASVYWTDPTDPTGNTRLDTIYVPELYVPSPAQGQSQSSPNRRESSHSESLTVTALPSAKQEIAVPVDTRKLEHIVWALRIPADSRVLNLNVVPDSTAVEKILTLTQQERRVDLLMETTEPDSGTESLKPLVLNLDVLKTRRGNSVVVINHVDSTGITREQFQRLPVTSVPRQNSKSLFVVSVVVPSREFRVLEKAAISGRLKARPVIVKPGDERGQLNSELAKELETLSVPRVSRAETAIIWGIEPETTDPPQE